MKHKTHHLYYLFYPRNWIIIVFLFCDALLIAQEQSTSPNEFPISTTIFDTLISNPELLNSFKATGFNTIWQRADSSTQELLEEYNLFAANADTNIEYIYHYSTAYYSKWEAEQNQTDPSRVGVKHIGGKKAFWDSTWCWSTNDLTVPTCSLMYGPHYRQEKRYKRWLYGCTSGDECLTYTPRFRMALDNYGGAGSNENVCVIKVVFRYKVGTQFYDTTFIARTLKVGDFDTSGNFEDFYLDVIPDSGRYEYFPNFILPKDFTLIDGSSSIVNYIDWESDTGIQFYVDWLRSDTLCTLYIDYAEVYDNAGWNDFIDHPDEIAELITDYALRFSDWENLKYWVGANEPYTIDAYTPIHIVDSLIKSVQAPPLVVNVQPSWWKEFNVSGQDEMLQFKDSVNPKKYLLNYLPKEILREKYLKLESLK